jgi:hypothetical protein
MYAANLCGAIDGTKSYHPYRLGEHIVIPASNQGCEIRKKSLNAIGRCAKTRSSEFLKAIARLEEKNGDKGHQCNAAIEHNVLSLIEGEKTKLTDGTTVGIVTDCLGITVFCKIMNIANVDGLGGYRHHKERQQQPCYKSPLGVVFVMIH